MEEEGDEEYLWIQLEEIAITTPPQPPDTPTPTTNGHCNTATPTSTAFSSSSYLVNIGAKSQRDLTKFLATISGAPPLPMSCSFSEQL
jgi:hypothetical protein